MEDFKLSDFMDCYKNLEKTLDHMHLIAMENLRQICKGCLKQKECWNGIHFIDLLLYEDRTCLNYFPSDDAKSCETCKVKNICGFKDTTINGAKRHFCSEYSKE